MKIIYYPLVLIGCLAINITAQAQDRDSTGLPGDNFSLKGALEMFKRAGSPEEFEKLINTEDNSVNNLDLNADGETDYVRVIDNAGTDAHAFVLQVAVSETENQDVAVIELEKTGDAKAELQIIGDEDLYGEAVIVEPRGEDVSVVEEGSNSKARGPYSPELSFQPNIVVVNVWFWPSVRLVFGPVYRPWISPWRWRAYPVWYKPWRPFSWHVYHPRVYRYYRPFVVVHTQRLVRAHQVYAPLRVTSVSVRTRHSVAVSNYRINHSRSTISGRRGASVSRSTTVVRGQNRARGRTSRARRVR